MKAVPSSILAPTAFPPRSPTTPTATSTVPTMSAPTLTASASYNNLSAMAALQQAFPLSPPNRLHSASVHTPNSAMASCDATTAAVQLATLKTPIIPSVFRPPIPSSRSTPSLTSLVNTSNAIHLPHQTSIANRRHSSELCRLGNAFFSQHEYNVAVTIYTQALELNSTDARAWNNRGTAYVAQKLFNMGIRDYNEAIALAPDLGELYYKRGVAYSALKLYNAAIEDYTRCLEKTPKFADALNNRGNAFRIIHQYTLARNDLELAVKLVPTNQLYRSNLQKVNAALAEEAKNGGQNNHQKEMERNVMQSVLASKLNMGARGFDSRNSTPALNEQWVTPYLQQLSPELYPSLIRLLQDRMKQEKLKTPASSIPVKLEEKALPKRSRQYSDSDATSSSEEESEFKQVNSKKIRLSSRATNMNRAEEITTGPVSSSGSSSSLSSLDAVSPPHSALPSFNPLSTSVPSTPLQT